MTVQIVKITVEWVDGLTVEFTRKELPGHTVDWLEAE